MVERFPELPERKFEELPALPFAEIRETLDDLLTATANLIERNWPSVGYPPELQTVFLGIVKITENTYRTIRYLCADKPEDPTRKMEFSVSVPPLARTILDSVFNVIFILEDPRERLVMFKKSGWRELYEDYQRHVEAYGSDPNWKENLGLQKWSVDYCQNEFGVTAEEAKNPEQIRWWPNPGKMPKAKGLSESKANFLQYLNDWFYKSLSADSHLSWPGFSRRVVHFLNPNEEQRLNTLRKYKSDCVLTSITLMLCLLSEIEAEFNFGRNGRLKEVWEKVSTIWGEAKELLEMRYRSRLK